MQLPTPPPPPATGWVPVRQRHRNPPTQCTADEPIAQRTRARGQNAFAILATDDEDETRHTPNLACPVLDTTTGQQLEHRQLRRHPDYKEVWDTSYANELGRLCQGIGTSEVAPTKKRVEGTDTFRPIQYHDIPHDRRADITYTRVVCEVRPQKQEPNRTRITIGGNRIYYPGDTGTKTGSLELVKLMLNDALSTPQARFA
jgi:hypothetical protein